MSQTVSICPVVHHTTFDRIAGFEPTLPATRCCVLAILDDVFSAGLLSAAPWESNPHLSKCNVGTLPLSYHHGSRRDDRELNPNLRHLMDRALPLSYTTFMGLMSGIEPESRSARSRSTLRERRKCEESRSPVVPPLGRLHACGDLK